MYDWFPVLFLFGFSFSGGSQTTGTNDTIRNRTPLSTRRSRRMVSSESSIGGTVSPPPTLPSTPTTPTTTPMATTTTTKASSAVKSKKSPAMSLRERRFKRREATKNSNDGGVAATKAISLNPDTEANKSIANNNNNQNHDGASSSQNTRSDIELSNGVTVALQTDTTPIKNRSTAIENCRQNLSAKICDLTKRNDDFIRDSDNTAAAVAVASTTAAASAMNPINTPKLNGIVKLPINGLMPRRSRKGIPHKLDLLDITNGYDDSETDIESSCDGSGGSAGDVIEAKLPPPIVAITQKPITTNGIVNGATAMSRKRKISKSVSESESTSSWENKAPPEAQNGVTAKNGLSNGIVLQPEHVLLKTPERRLKLTLRMKRSPMLDDLIESGTNLSDGSGNSAYTNNTHYAPEYEVFRVEGLLDNSDDESSFDTSPTTTKLHQQKRKKRHKTKAKSHRHRHRKQSQQHRQYDLEQTSSEDNHTHLNNHTHNKNCSHEQQSQQQQQQIHEKPSYMNNKVHYGNNGDSKIHNNHIRHLNISKSCTSDHHNSALLPKSSSSSSSSSSTSNTSSSHTQPMKRLRLIFGNETRTIDIPQITAQSPNTTTSTTRLIPT